MSVDIAKRRRFEALLVLTLKSEARRPINSAGARMIPEFPTTFREGFKCCLKVLGLIEQSTTELNEKQMEIMIRELEIISGEKPPLPPSPQ